MSAEYAKLAQLLATEKAAPLRLKTSRNLLAWNLNWVRVFESLFLPSQPQFGSLNTSRSLNRQAIAPLLKNLRAKRTLKEVQKLLGLKSVATYHHWETGNREVPFLVFLRILHEFGKKLHLFCEMIESNIDLEALGFGKSPENFSKLFFSKPWIPSVYLALQTEKFERAQGQFLKNLSQRLGLTAFELQEALDVLTELALLETKNSKYQLRKGQFYLPTHIDPGVKESIHHYWYSRSEKMLDRPGFHRVEEHATSRESIKKIEAWILELREKIKEEVKGSNPETILHINWQLFDLLG